MWDKLVLDPQMIVKRALNASLNDFMGDTEMEKIFITAVFNMD